MTTRSDTTGLFLHTVRLLFPTALVLGLSSHNHAAELTASDGAAFENFGFSVGISGNTAIVGAYRDNDNGIESGSAYVFSDVGGANTQTKLTASDGTASDYFGHSVGISGSTAIVSAFLDDDNGSNSGSVYVFSDVGGTNTQTKLTASDSTADDIFGRSVGISGSTAIVGASLDDVSGINSGSAYVFSDLGGTNAQTKLTASDGAANDQFGLSVGISGSTAIVGAYGDDDNGTSSGSAYLFSDVGGTNTQTKLTATDGAPSDNFGWSVGISGSMAIVGAYADDDKGSASGSVYLFSDLGGTNTQTKLSATDGAADDHFGFSVGISGSMAIVGAYLDDDNGNNSGSAYVFSDVGGMNTETKLIASDGAANDQFGISVAIDSDNFVVGAFGKNSNTGKAYTGSVSSVTTLDEGNTSRTISGISFLSQGDWIIGETTDSNQVTLSAGDTATVTAASKEVYIGMNAGSDGNTLEIQGNLIASIVNIGAETGTEGNQLRLANTATIDAVSFIMGESSSLAIEGDYTSDGALLAYMDDTGLQAWNGTALETVTSGNQSSLLESTFTGGYTTFAVIPEPSALLLSLLGLVPAMRRRK